MRVGDAERDACVSALMEHHLHGRLPVDELDRRQRGALAAVTAADLKLLLADLPETTNEIEPSAARRSRALLSDDTADLATRAAHTLVPAATVLAGATFAQQLWDLSAEGPFLGALLGGAIGYASRAVMSRFRR